MSVSLTKACIYSSNGIDYHSMNNNNRTNINNNNANNNNSNNCNNDMIMILLLLMIELYNWYNSNSNTISMFNLDILLIKKCKNFAKILQKFCKNFDRKTPLVTVHIHYYIKYNIPIIIITWYINILDYILT